MNQIYYHSRRLSNVSGCLLPILAILASGSLSARTVHPLMEDWSFSLGEINALEIAPENDAQWIPVDLPHDWSITGLRQEDAPTAGGGGFFPSGTGWYRKTFDAPKHWLNQRILLVFEGVMQRATVWINGHELGTNLNGYLHFSHDLTEWIEPGSENTILVRSDTVEQPASRWYTGAGIYRPVRLEVVDPVHVPEDGLFISAMDIYPVAATMDVRVPVLNTTDATVKTTVKAFLIDPKGILPH